MTTWSDNPAEEREITEVVRGVVSVGGEPCGALRSQLTGGDAATEVWKQLGELGFLGINVAEDHGGQGLGLRALLPLLSEAGRALLPVPIVETVMVTLPVLDVFAADLQRERWLPAIMSGELTTTVVGFDPRLGLAPSALPVIASLASDAASTHLDGICPFVPYGTTADVFLVIARSDCDRACAVLVERDSPGISVESVPTMDDTTPVARVRFDGVSGVHVIDDGTRFSTEFVLERTWLGVSMLTLGASQRVVEMAVRHAKERTQFGYPIGMYQAIKHRIVDMWLASEQLLSLVAYAGHAVDLELVDAERVVWGARVFGGGALIRMASDNVQVHGGMGFTDEMDCHLYVKRAWTWANYWATPGRVRSMMAAVDDADALARL